jgi:hypothetical protein
VLASSCIRRFALIHGELGDTISPFVTGDQERIPRSIKFVRSTDFQVRTEPVAPLLFGSCRGHAAGGTLPGHCRGHPFTHLFELGREKRVANKSVNSARLTLPSSR